MGRLIPFLLLVLLTAARSLSAAETNSTPAIPATADAISGLKEISPGVFDLNGIRLDKQQRRISFAGSINQREGLIEYLLVNEKGKTHESLLKTTILPRDIHVALLLIGLEPSAIPPQKEIPPPDAIDPSYLHAAPKIKGAPVTISVAWTIDGKRREAPLDKWVFNLQTNQAMTAGPWTYNGSMIENGVFLADVELSIIAVITDPTALVNNPRDGYDNDEIWQVKTTEVPVLDTPVEVSITLEKAAPSK